MFSVRLDTPSTIPTHAVCLRVCMYRTIDNPKCGFSQETLKLLEGTGSAFTCIDVLDEEANPGVREAVKQIAMWPTIPQVSARVLSLQRPLQMDTEKRIHTRAKRLQLK